MKRIIKKEIMMKKLGSWYQCEVFKENLQGYEENQVEDRILRLEEKIEEMVEWINEQGGVRGQKQGKEPE